MRSCCATCCSGDERGPAGFLANRGLRPPRLRVSGCSCRYGGVARSELALAVTRARGFGFLGMVREPPELIRREVEAMRRGTPRPFGVNLIPAATLPDLLEAQVRTCIELEVPVMALFWDLRPDLVRRFCDAGMVVICQVGSAGGPRLCALCCRSWSLGAPFPCLRVAWSMGGISSMCCGWARKASSSRRRW
jgi:hypothetical protein